MSSRIIPVHPEAPPKPAAGQPCNGCGVCCLYEPCPLGQLLSRRRQGACAALRWDLRSQRYLCGAVAYPRDILETALPTGLRWTVALLLPLLPGMARRWIAAGKGCDCELEVLSRAESDGQSLP